MSYRFVIFIFKLSAQTAFTQCFILNCDLTKVGKKKKATHSKHEDDPICPFTNIPF